MTAGPARSALPRHAEIANLEHELAALRHSAALAERADRYTMVVLKVTFVVVAGLAALYAVRHDALAGIILLTLWLAVGVLFWLARRNADRRVDNWVDNWVPSAYFGEDYDRRLAYWIAVREKRLAELRKQGP